MFFFFSPFLTILKKTGCINTVRFIYKLYIPQIWDLVKNIWKCSGALSPSLTFSFLLAGRLEHTWEQTRALLNVLGRTESSGQNRPHNKSALLLQPWLIPEMNYSWLVGNSHMVWNLMNINDFSMQNLQNSESKFK